jgi:superkiller protein 3
MARSNKGFELSDAGRREEAADHFRRAITALGNVADEFRTTRAYRQQLGRCCMGLVRTSSDPDEKQLMLSRTLPLWEQLTADFPQRKWIWCDLGDVYAALGQWQKAADAQTKEIELNADYWLAWYRRGRVHTQLGQWESAVSDLTRAVELKPDNCWAWWHRGRSYLKLKQWAKALADCDRAIELGATNSEVWVAKAAAHVRLNQPDSAITALQQAVAKGFRDANHLKNHEDLAGLREREDFKQLVAGLEVRAIAAEREAVRLKPDDPLAHYNLGVALEKQGRAEEAIACYRKAIELDPKNARAYLRLGNAFRAQKKWDEAVAEYRKALEVSPTDVGARDALAWGLNNLAWALAAHPEPARRDPDRAVSLAREALELKPQEGSIGHTLGVALYRAERWKEAVAALEKSMELRKGGDSIDWFFLAMAHWKLGEKDKAHAWYDRAVQWMDKNSPRSEELRRFREEAAGLLKIHDDKSKPPASR